MAYTRHGHQITGSPVEEPKPQNVARCGGPGLCVNCSLDSTTWRQQQEHPGTSPDRYSLLPAVGELEADPESRRIIALKAAARVGASRQFVGTTQDGIIEMAKRFEHYLDSGD